ncbi:MAG: capsular polysaccharide synthesis protein [Blautia sp.]|nr:capsular polysaccharide synthesis protein [Blautia sp.]MCM1200758.1 capsular polysaccharide synthesis protein [Bacteroides fragilis]
MESDETVNSKKISGLEELAELFRHAGQIKLYGAGLRLASFMEMTTEAEMPFHAECVLVSSARGNPGTAYGLPVVEVSKASFHEEDVILLTISDVFAADAEKLLAEYGVTRNVYRLDYTMIDNIPYTMIYQAVEPFVKTWPEHASGLNLPAGTEKRVVWSCWWQGEDNAPGLVKKCLESQKKSLPERTEHIVITWDNYKDYAELPEYIIRKAESGKIGPAHLADIIRCALLYKYGGIWLDATVYMTDRLPEECFAQELLTRSTGEKIYCTNVSWVTWFLGGRRGEELYRFIMEAFFCYLKDNDEIPHYYMIDFLIAIACRNIAGVEEKLGKIPVNNECATRLQKHLREAYEEEAYRSYTEGGFLQKLTYKERGYGADSIYSHLVDAE